MKNAAPSSASTPTLPVTSTLPQYMNCLVIGDTGLLGYHAALELLRRGQRVNVLALPPLPVEDLLPLAVRVALADLNALADDRSTPRRPAYDFFYNAKVNADARSVVCLITQARRGVRRGVLFGFSFTYSDRLLTRHKPLAKPSPAESLPQLLRQLRFCQVATTRSDVVLCCPRADKKKPSGL
jgi:hypothetical protein